MHRANGDSASRLRERTCGSPAAGPWRRRRRMGGATSAVTCGGPAERARRRRRRIAAGDAAGTGSPEIVVSLPCASGVAPPTPAARCSRSNGGDCCGPVQVAGDEEARDIEELRSDLAARAVVGMDDVHQLLEEMPVRYYAQYTRIPLVASPPGPLVGPGCTPNW